MSSEEYIYPILPGTDWREHTPECPFCGDMSCECHEDEELIGELNQQYQDGLVSADDADRIYRGKTI